MRLPQVGRMMNRRNWPASRTRRTNGVIAPRRESPRPPRPAVPDGCRPIAAVAAALRDRLDHTAPPPDRASRFQAKSAREARRQAAFAGVLTQNVAVGFGDSIGRFAKYGLNLLVDFAATLSSQLDCGLVAEVIIASC